MADHNPSPWNGYFTQPAWSPDGRFLAVCLSNWVNPPRRWSRDYSFHTLVLDFEAREYIHRPYFWRYFAWSPPGATVVVPSIQDER